MSTMRKIGHRIMARRWLVILLLLLLLVLLQIFSSPQIQQFFQLTTAPDLPPLKQYDRVVFLSGSQNWDADPDNPDRVGPITHKYHHITQGTSTFPIPRNWVLALEEPASNLFTMPFSRKGKFMADEYFLRYGFIASEQSDDNPDGLPIGVAITRYESLDGIDNKVDVVGFTCAACHTGQIAYENTQYIVEGAPAIADFGNIIVGLGAAIGQTLASSYIPVLNGRWERFTRAALEPDAYNPENVARLQSQLREVVLRNFRQPNTVEVIEGYARTDALNRIGNRVFAIDANRFDNYAAVDAPVNYPHIWTTSWFKWVQYDASIMQPLFRNLGEALGVYANVGLDAPSEEGRFFSAVPLENLVWLEDWLKGPQNPSIDQEFNGLLAPDWPDQFPPINMTRAAQGEVLYKEMCVRCHLPPINGQLTDNLGQPVNEPDFFEDTIWNHFEPIQWWVGDQPQPESEPVLNLRVIPIDVVGTDPATGEVLATRKVNSAGFAGGVTAESTLGMEIDELVCAWEPQAPESPWESMGQAGSPSPNQPLTDGASAGAQPQPRLVGTRVSDNPNGLYSLLLGSLVQAVANQWFLKNDYPDEVKLQMMGNRPNCFQAGKGYKARPHDGIWATAPFLHNGSVPTLWDLLSPVEDRPKYVLLGDIEFDVEKVGLVQPENFQPRSGNKYDRSGYFVLDTSIPGNLNIGHEFRGDGSGGKGVIGRGLSDAERMDLIEYLKTL